jgi:ATP-binding cassette subfamily C protein
LVSENLNKLSTYSILRLSYDLLPPSAKLKYVLAVVIQITLNLLELMGIGLVLGLAAISINGLKGTAPSPLVQEALNTLQIDGFAPKYQLYILSILVIFIFISRTALSIYLINKNLFFLSNRGAELSSNLIDKTLKLEHSEIKGESTQELLWAVTGGVNTICLGILGTVMTIIADLSLTIILIIGILVISPIIGLVSVVIFGGVVVLLHFKFKNKIYNLSAQSTQLNITSTEMILDVIYTFRELYVRNQINKYKNDISSLRLRSSKLLAQQAMLPNYTKYIMDISVVLGVFIVMFIQFTFLDTNRAVATLTIFMTASARIAPALLRMQQGLLTIRSNMGTARLTFKLINKLANTEIDQPVPLHKDEKILETSGIELSNVYFNYKGSETSAIKDITLSIKSGSSSAIVGISGGGKTTLIDLISGVHKPSNGTVKVFGHDPRRLILSHENIFGFVPQDIYLKGASIRENISLGFPQNYFSDEDLWDSIKAANLEEFIKSKKSGLDFIIKERGSNVSGGQRQRIGIARALVSKPRILLLDEATSSLDADSENTFSELLKTIKGKITVITVAHRLSTIKEYENILYIKDGKLLCNGTFDEVRINVPEFDQQARILGI